VINWNRRQRSHGSSHGTNSELNKNNMLIVDDEEENSELFYFDYERLMNDRATMLHRDGYFLGASNDFVRIFTIKGRKYWLAQAITNHRAPDWKIHFSVCEQDIPKAFNILAEHFFRSKRQFGLKATFTNNNWPQHMKGREITLYIYHFYDLDKYRTVQEFNEQLQLIPIDLNDQNNEFYNKLSEFNSVDHPFHIYELTAEDCEDVRELRKWIIEAEQLLSDANIKSNGCADGDRWLNGKYASLRNETFIVLSRKREMYPNDVERLFTYPPNNAGWNGANDPNGELLFSMLRLDQVPVIPFRVVAAQMLFIGTCLCSHLL
jgi:hypothetical protein